VVVVAGPVVVVCVVVVTADVEVVLVVVVVVVVIGQLTQHGSDGVSWSVAAGWMTAFDPIVGGGAILYWRRFCTPALSIPLMVIVELAWMVLVPANKPPGPSAESTPDGVMFTVQP
jgi:hypothetical protein